MRRLADLVQRPTGRARKPAMYGLHSMNRPGADLPYAEQAMATQRSGKGPWFEQDPDAQPSYDQDQAARATAALAREERELNATW